MATIYADDLLPVAPKPTIVYGYRRPDGTVVLDTSVQKHEIDADFANWSMFDKCEKIAFDLDKLKAAIVEW